MISFQDNVTEYYCSGQFFKNKYDISGDELARLAEKKDPSAIRIFEEFGSNLAFAVKNFLFAYAPESIIFGGSVSESYIYFEKSLLKNIKDFPYPSLLKKIKLEVRSLD